MLPHKVTVSQLQEDHTPSREYPTINQQVPSNISNIIIIYNHPGHYRMDLI